MRERFDRRPRDDVEPPITAAHAPDPSGFRANNTAAACPAVHTVDKAVGRLGTVRLRRKDGSPPSAGRLPLHDFQGSKVGVVGRDYPVERRGSACGVEGVGSLPPPSTCGVEGVGRRPRALPPLPPPQGYLLDLAEEPVP